MHFGTSTICKFSECLKINKGLKKLDLCFKKKIFFFKKFNSPFLKKKIGFCKMEEFDAIVLLNAISENEYLNSLYFGFLFIF